MSLKASAKSGNFELPKMGCFQGVVFAVYDGGMLPDKFNPGETVHKMRFGIELNTLYESGQYEGQRVTRYPEFSVSLSEKANLLPVVEAMIKRALTEDEKLDYELEDLIGKNCAVTITHKVSGAGKEYAVDHIGALMDGMKEIQPVLQRDYKSEFIVKWQNQGQPTQTDEPVINLKQITAMAEKQLNQFVADGLLNFPDISSTITVITKKKQLFREIQDKEMIDKVMQKCIALAEQRKSERLTEGTDFNDSPVKF